MLPSVLRCRLHWGQLTGQAGWLGRVAGALIDKRPASNGAYEIENQPHNRPHKRAPGRLTRTSPARSHSLSLTLMELSMMHCSHIFLSLSLFFSLFHILVVVINCFVAALIDAPAPYTPRRRQRTEKPIPATTFASVHLPVRLGHGTIIEICFLAITDQRARCVRFGVGFEFRVGAASAAAAAALMI